MTHTSRHQSPLSFPSPFSTSPEKKALTWLFCAFLCFAVFRPPPTPNTHQYRTTILCFHKPTFSWAPFLQFLMYVCVSVHPSVCGRVGVDGLQVSFLPNVKLSGNTESAFLSPSQDSNVNFQPYSSGLLLKLLGWHSQILLLENQNLAAESGSSHFNS